MSIGYSVVSAVSHNSSKSSISSEMGSGMPLVVYCPEDIAGKGGKDKQQSTTIWRQIMVAGRQGVLWICKKIKDFCVEAAMIRQTRQKPIQEQLLSQEERMKIRKIRVGKDQVLLGDIVVAIAQ